jgi:hypothetical protein
MNAAGLILLVAASAHAEVMPGLLWVMERGNVFHACQFVPEHLAACHALVRAVTGLPDASFQALADAADHARYQASNN